MARKRDVLFDLDGTLTDPGVGITNSIAYALKRFGIVGESYDSLKRCVGPPLLDSFMGFFSLSEQDSNKAIGYYREYFSETGIFENEVYSGIPEMLEALKADGRRLIIATSKPIVFTVRILEHFSLDGYFSFVSGSELDGRRSKKAEVIEYALDSLSISDRSGCVMVGDRMHDIIGAQTALVDSVGVLYGYGSREELEEARAGHIVSSVEELRSFLLSR